MPQAVDLPVSPGRSSKQTARASRTSEPTSRFDDVLSKRSRVERSRESDSSKKADEVASKKSDRAERPEKSDKAEKQPKAEKPQLDRVDESDEAVVESESPVSDDSSEPTVAENAPEEGAAVVVDGDEGSQDTDADASVDEASTDVDPALAALAIAPVADAATDESTAATDEVGDDDSTSLDPLSLTKLTAKPAAETKPTPGQASSADDAVDAEPVDEGVQASGLKIPEGASGSEAETTDAEALPQMSGSKVDAAAATTSPAPVDADADATVQLQPTQAKPVAQPAPVAQPQAVQHPDDRFVEQNVDRIVTGIKSDLTPNGGTMKIRLDPPNLGQLNIDVSIDDGVLTASFQTSNEEATRLLSHSMQQLKHTLESAGVSVDRIQVRQTSSTEQSSNSRSGDQDQQQQQQGGHDHPERQEQQRREALQKMWAKLALGEEPLDMVA